MSDGVKRHGCQLTLIDFASLLMYGLNAYLTHDKQCSNSWYRERLTVKCADGFLSSMTGGVMEIWSQIYVHEHSVQSVHLQLTSGLLGNM